MAIVELYSNRPSELTGMRYHELALQKWLYDNFHVVEGYPVPVVFSTPMDAFANFKELWATEASKNPFRHLLDAKDESGTPLYEPYPSPARYPLFSVFRKGWKFRSWQNYSIHRWRRLSWPTIAGAPSRGDLGLVAQAGMPMAWDFMFQLDFFCLRPDTLAIFVKHFMRKMHRSGGIPQTWLETAYPFYGRMLTRMTLDGDINSMTPEQPPDGSNVEFRVSLNLTVEGFEPDIDIVEVPALWNMVLGVRAPSPVDSTLLHSLYGQSIELKDPSRPRSNANMNLRVSPYNPNVTEIPDYSI